MRVLLATSCLIACSTDRPSEPTVPQVALNVAALTLAGIDDACYDVLVSNGASTVWQRDHQCSSVYGNGAGGDIALVGPCDAQVDSDPSKPGTQNDVTVWVDGLFASGVDVGDWRDPCPNGCTQSFDCNASSDTRVGFDLVVMRSANQGFFDLAVSFDDVFCSAKLDTCYANGAHIQMLFGADDQRDWTGVFGFACSAGADASATQLQYGSVAVTCTNGDVFVIDPKAGPGNARVLSKTNDAHVLHLGIYRDTEDLDCGTGVGSCHKLFWNVALSLDDLAAFGTCSLAFAATANQSERPFVNGRPNGVGLVYPYIQVSSLLTSNGVASCQDNALDDGGDVATEYCGPASGLPCPVTCSLYDGVTVSGTGVGATDCPIPPIECAPALLNDNDACTVDHCNTVDGSATHTPGAIVSDNDACTQDGCNPSNGSPTHTPISGPIDCDPNTVGDSCQSGVCVPGGCNVNATPFGGGDGSVNNPFLICARAHLQNVGSAAANSNFKQVVDLDLDGVVYNGPVVTTLNGAYDGASHTLANLTIDTTTTFVGLFGTVAATGSVRDLTLTDVDVKAGNRVGGLAGAVLVGGSLTRVRVVGGVVRGTDGSAGGLVGANGGVIVRAMSSANVIMTAGDGAGGLAGRHQCNKCSQVCTITESYATGNVTNSGTGVFDCGGLVGRHQGGLIDKSFATGDVSSTSDNTGGLIGRLNGPIADSYFLGTVTRPTGQGYNIGGLVGQANAVGGECNAGNAQRLYSASTFVQGNSCTTPGGGCPTCTAIRGTVAGQLGNGTAVASLYYWKEVENPGTVFANALSPQCWTPGGGITPTQCQSDASTCSAMVVGLGVIDQQAHYTAFDFSAAGAWRWPTTNPLARIPPGGTTRLVTPVLAWQCGVDGVVCGP